jgi:hypothetical protein
MAAFLLDENVPAMLRPALRAAGHDVVDPRELDRRKFPDEALLLEAARAGRVLVTHNRNDFAMLQRAWRSWPPSWGVSPLPAHAGILVLPQPPRATLADMVQAIHALLTGGAPLENSFWRWSTTAGWVEGPPDR